MYEREVLLRYFLTTSGRRQSPAVVRYSYATWIRIPDAVEITLSSCSPTQNVLSIACLCGGRDMSLSAQASTVQASVRLAVVIICNSS